MEEASKMEEREKLRHGRGRCGAGGAAGPAVYPGSFCKQYLALIISNFLPLNCVLDIS